MFLGEWESELKKKFIKSEQIPKEHNLNKLKSNCTRKYLRHLGGVHLQTNQFLHFCSDERAKTLDTGIPFFGLINMAVRSTRGKVALRLSTFLPCTFYQISCYLIPRKYFCSDFILHSMYSASYGKRHLGSIFHWNADSPLPSTQHF